MSGAGGGESTLAGLTSELASLKAGMKRIPFPQDSYQHPSLPLSQKKLLNFYAEQGAHDGRVPVALVPTPALALDYTFGTGPILALNADLPGRLYLVSGTHAYRQSTTIGGQTVDDMGSVGTPASGTIPSYDLMVTIAVGPTSAVICVPPNCYTCNHNPGSPINPIGGTFPGAATVCYLDGYYIFTNYENSAQFFISNLFDPATYNALNFAYSDGVTNVIRRVIAHRGEIWLLGEVGIEIWYDVGSNTVTLGPTGIGSSFPFLRQSGGIIEFGVATPKSFAQAENSVFWVGPDSIVYQADTYQPKRISTHAIEIFIEANNPSLVVSGLVCTSGGHLFYCFTLANETLCYDLRTGLWHNRSSSADGTGRWLPNNSATQGGAVLFGDWASGNVYFSDPRQDDDNGVLVLRQIITPPIYAGTHRAFMNRVEIEMEVGDTLPGNTITLEVSDDGGYTWKPSRPLNAGAITAYRTRVYTTRLGSFRQRCFRISMLGSSTLYALDADVSYPQLG